jgi:hypothetical protein
LVIVNTWRGFSARRSRVRGTPTCTAHRIGQDKLDLGVHTAKFVRRPTFQVVVQLRINAEQVSLSLAQ